jgi:6,7-dimethyl-8-ribityllumazine synthase
VDEPRLGRGKKKTLGHGHTDGISGQTVEQNSWDRFIAGSPLERVEDTMALLEEEIVHIIEAKLDASGLKFALVVSRFNEALTTRLESGAVDCLVRHGAQEDHISVVRVPGAWEIPLVAAKLADSGVFDAIVCLGALVRGGTPHFDLIAAEVSKGIAQAAVKTGVPITFGVITADSLEQAVERAGTKMGNKGWEAAQAAIEMARLYGLVAGDQ